MNPPPAIGKHLASLNLFREADGSVHITVFNAMGAIEEYDRGKAGTHERPIDYVEELIVEAAGNIAKRRAEIGLRTVRLKIVGKEDE